jgi:hypothetical protein
MGVSMSISDDHEQPSDPVTAADRMPPAGVEPSEPSPVSDRDEPSGGEGRSDGGAIGRSWLGGWSRRAFLRRGTLTAAVVGVAGSVPALSGMLSEGSSDAPAVESSAAEASGEAAPLTEPLMAYVKDAGTGEISLFQGEQEVVVRDPALASRLLSAARP